MLNRSCDCIIQFWLLCLFKSASVTIKIMTMEWSRLIYSLLFYLLTRRPPYIFNQSRLIEFRYWDCQRVVTRAGSSLNAPVISWHQPLEAAHCVPTSRGWQRPPIPLPTTHLCLSLQSGWISSDTVPEQASVSGNGKFPGQRKSSKLQMMTTGP